MAFSCMFALLGDKQMAWVHLGVSQVRPPNFLILVCLMGISKNLINVKTSDLYTGTCPSYRFTFTLEFFFTSNYCFLVSKAGVPLELLRLILQEKPGERGRK